MEKINFNFTNERPIYSQLIDQLECYIISGEFPPGSRLPSVRNLSTMARVNPNTMQRALAELEDLKLITTERTNGKFITADAALINRLREKYARTKVKIFTTEMSQLGFTSREIIKLLKQEGKD